MCDEKMYCVCFLFQIKIDVKRQLIKDLSSNESIDKILDHLHLNQTDDEPDKAKQTRTETDMKDESKGEEKRKAEQQEKENKQQEQDRIYFKGEKVIISGIPDSDDKCKFNGFVATITGNIPGYKNIYQVFVDWVKYEYPFDKQPVQRVMTRIDAKYLIEKKKI